MAHSGGSAVLLALVHNGFASSYRSALTFFTCSSSNSTNHDSKIWTCGPLIICGGPLLTIMWVSLNPSMTLCWNRKGVPKIRSYICRFAMSKYHSQLIPWYSRHAFVPKLTFEHKPWTASCIISGFARVIHSMLSCSARFDDIKSAKDPVSNSARAGCLLMWTTTTIGLGTGRLKSFTTMVFRSRAACKPCGT